jgi:hypothetical protein
MGGRRTYGKKERAIEGATPQGERKFECRGRVAGDGNKRELLTPFDAALALLHQHSIRHRRTSLGAKLGSTFYASQLAGLPSCFSRPRRPISSFNLRLLPLRLPPPPHPRQLTAVRTQYPAMPLFSADSDDERKPELEDQNDYLLQENSGDEEEEDELASQEGPRPFPYFKESAVLPPRYFGSKTLKGALFFPPKGNGTREDNVDLT